MECGVHGPAGRLAVRHVVAALEKDSDSAIVLSPPTTVHTAPVLDLRRRNAMVQVLVPVSYIYNDPHYQY